MVSIFSRDWQYHGTITRYFFSTAIGNDDTFLKNTVFSTVGTVLHDISVTFFLTYFERKSENLF